MFTLKIACIQFRSSIKVLAPKYSLLVVCTPFLWCVFISSKAIVHNHTGIAISLVTSFMFPWDSDEILQLIHHSPMSKFAVENFKFESKAP